MYYGSKNKRQSSLRREQIEGLISDGLTKEVIIYPYISKVMLKYNGNRLPDYFFLKNEYDTLILVVEMFDKIIKSGSTLIIKGEIKND